MLASGPVNPMPPVHAAALLLWAASLAVVALGATRPLSPALARLTALRVPAAALALFSAVSLFHHQPTQIFTAAGKVRAGLVLLLLGADATLDLLQGRAGRRIELARALPVLAALVLLSAATQCVLTWVTPWAT